MKFIVSLLLAACSVVSATNLRALTQRDLQNDVVFVAENGLVVMEAESVPIVAPWKLETDVPGYNGTGYLTFDGNSFSSGTPHLRMRARKNNTDSNTWGNDCYVKMVGYGGFKGDNVRAALGGLVKRNVWATRIDHMYGSPLTIETPSYELATAGTYELQVSGRTKHFVIDRVILYHVDMVTDFYARESVRPESPRIAGGTIAPVPAPTTPPTMAPVPKAASVIKSLDLVAAGTSNVLSSLKDGDVLDQSKVGTSLSILANIAGTVDRVEFNYAGLTWKEGLAPYAMAGNMGANNFPVDYLKTIGSKQLTIDVFAGGVKVDSLTVNFIIAESLTTDAPVQSPIASPVVAPVAIPASTASPIAAPVKSPTSSPIQMPVPVASPKLPDILFFLTTARLSVDTVIQELKNGDIINRSEAGTYLSIEATAPEVPSISKITFRYENIGHVESLAPYLMGGNNGPQNTPVNYLKTTGSKQVSAKVYDSLGAVVAERTIDFEIIDN